MVLLHLRGEGSCNADPIAIRSSFPPCQGDPCPRALPALQSVKDWQTEEQSPQKGAMSPRKLVMGIWKAA